uniref:Uncharacterized protein n=1 Tax=Octactis speculum TaxID=3111310 RepID=A0A7S2CUH3_9STRA
MSVEKTRTSKAGIWKHSKEDQKHAATAESAIVTSTAIGLSWNLSYNNGALMYVPDIRFCVICPWCDIPVSAIQATKENPFQKQRIRSGVSAGVWRYGRIRVLV